MSGRNPENPAISLAAGAGRLFRSLDPLLDHGHSSELSEERSCEFNERSFNSSNRFLPLVGLKCPCDEKVNPYFSLDFKTMLTKH